MNRDATLTRAARLTAALCGYALFACSLPVLAAAGPVPGAPARIALDAFEARKKSVALPDGETLAYLTMGDPAGTPVVLIHGYTDSARDWVPLIPYLAPRLKLILVDLRGHGRSGKPECCYTRLDFAYDIKLLLDALHVERADIVGHSMGSFIAQTFAEFWPERTGRVVLISSAGGRRPAAGRLAAGAEARLRGGNPSAQGADRPGLEVHDRVVVVSDPGRSRFSPSPAPGRGGNPAARLGRGAR
ncbi:MAG TPA: alpha/beta fold hydrolase [Steroidobacteraceae bacterium]|nr:alpha/beta fold hydrolase [Steroidobacteraceae bacterium]